MKIEASVNQDEIRLDESLIYTFNILNQSDKDMRNIIFNPYVINELSFVGGSVKRQRGVMDIEKEYINLEIGNLAPKENATIIIELKLSDNFKATTDNLYIEIKCYGIVIFNNHKNTKRTITSNIVDTKIIGHTF
ncbi:MAG TPA: hypothetical protein GX707_03330 [Epulopiscium sp.]|nr:hypothetical protein [Candidatus Epulonipiscium sp.]